MTRALRTLLALLVAAATLAGLTACTDDAPVTYAPVAYGQVVGGVGRCYYTDNPGEAYLLIAAGKCPASWVAYPMPDAWHETYWSYYSSPAWIDVYVPSAQRSYYRTTYVTHYYSVNRTAIVRQSGSATYRASNGSTVKGSSKVTFGGGTGRSYTGTTQTERRDSQSGSTYRRSSSGSSFGSSSGRRRP